MISKWLVANVPLVARLVQFRGGLEEAISCPGLRLVFVTGVDWGFVGTGATPDLVFEAVDVPATVLQAITPLLGFEAFCTGFFCCKLSVLPSAVLTIPRDH